MSNYSESKFINKSNSSWSKTFERIEPGSKVLDVGCSSGNFGQELIKRKKCIVDGIEIDHEDNKKAKTKLRNVYDISIDSEDIIQINEKYDVINMGDVIEHLTNPIRALSAIRPLLNDNGYILFSVPNMAHIGVRLQLLTGDFDYTETGLLDKTHLHFYNIKELERIFSESGYSISDLDYVKKDYPNDLIKDYLKSMGLTPNGKFLDAMHRPQAAAFQFIGIARPGRAMHIKIDNFGPVDMFESYYNDKVKMYENEIKSLKSEMSELKIYSQKWTSFKNNPIKFIFKKIINKY